MIARTGVRAIRPPYEYVSIRDASEALSEPLAPASVDRRGKRRLRVASFALVALVASASSSTSAHADPVNPYACDRAPRPVWTTSEVKCVIRVVFAAHAASALRVARCESEYHAHEVSPTSDYGVFQINRPSHPDAFRNGANAMLHPVTNSRYALRLSHNGTDWSAWVCGWAA